MTSRRRGGEEGWAPPPAIDAIVRAVSTAPVLGVEREYALDGPEGRVDFRTLVPTLEGLGPLLDPGDRNARRGDWGGVVTADGREAEVATEPVPVGPGAARQACRLADDGEDVVRRHLPPGVTLTGYSTHLNVEVDDEDVVAVARLVTRHFAVPLMLALDRTDSPGLLIRPRHGRLEVGGEYAVGEQLEAALTLALGIALLATDLVHDRRRRRALPPPPRVHPERARERFGWYVDRRAFGGVDLYGAGRAALLPLRRGGTAVVAQDVLARVWDLARPGVVGRCGQHDATVVDRLVDGRLPLPLEAPATTRRDADAVGAPDTDDRPPSRWRPRRRGDITVTVAGATWLGATLLVEEGDRQRWLTIPGRALAPVLDAVDAGHLDAALGELLGSPAPLGRPAH